VADVALAARANGHPLKAALNAVALVIMAPCAATVWLGKRFASHDGRLGVFAFWTHVVAWLPGTPGRFLRRGFYRWTLAQCAKDATIEFGALFSRPSAMVESEVYVGPYALIGSAHIGARSLIGSRASLLSGGAQHRWLPSGRWSQTDASSLETITIGPDCWIGEGAVVMASAGPGSMIAAGAVVSSAVPPGTMVAGNPARFVRKVTSE
jgi:acetyltransferase-like isoleucine patch superfamily enzyme